MPRILIRATNWVGDAVMSLPALAAVRRRFPDSHISILARPWVSGLYGQELFADEILPYQPRGGWNGWQDRKQIANDLRERRFDLALLLQNAFDAALITWMAGIPIRIGYARDGRTPLLTHAVEVPSRNGLPPHESFYYLELVRRAGWLDALPPGDPLIRLAAAPEARLRGGRRFREDGLGPTILGISPGAAYGTAKRWLPERFAAAAIQVAVQANAQVALFGSQAERSLCDWIERTISSQGIVARNFAGQTDLAEYIDRAAACTAYLTNDSGAMHIASALGVPTVAVFGATNPVTTGPTGPLARVIRHPVECSPCLLRECPIDHRCMKIVTSQEVAETLVNLIQPNK